MFSLNAKLLWRDWRGGQLNLIISALVMSVLVVTSVSLLADRIEKGLSDQVSSFLAADLAVRSKVEIGQEFNSRATQLNLRQAKVAQFRSMVFASGRSHLAVIKAVDENYPLRGVLEISQQGSLREAQLQQAEHGPNQGEIWVEPRLLNILQLQLGAELDIGYGKFRVTHLLLREPDRGSGFSFAGARLLMNYADLESTQLLRPGSQVTHRLLLAGPQSQIDSFQTWFESSIQQQQTADSVGHYSLLTPEGEETQLSDSLSRGRSFLLLSGTIGVLLAGLAMALASHRYARRLTDQVALMKAWGQSSRSIRVSHIQRLLLLTLLATVIGIALGWLAHAVLLYAAAGLFNAELPPAGWRPWVVAGVTGFVCVIGFALPAMWHLPAIAPLKVLRRDLPDDLVSQGRRLIIGVLALFVLSWWYSNSILTAAMFLAAVALLFAACTLIALQILKMVKRFGAWRGSFVRLGLANLWRRRAQTLIQLVGFSTTLMLLLVVTGLRTNLIDEWQAQVPASAPTHFIFNVASEEKAQIIDLLDADGLTTKRWYPMVRGRLVEINGEAISRQRINQASGLAREVNFTESLQMPDDNSLVAGSWWQAESTEKSFSMEQEVATELGIKLGDVVGFSVGGLRFEARLASIRKVNWESMNPNFYIVFSPGTLTPYSPNWITSLRDSNALANDQQAVYRQAQFINEVIQRFPTVVVLELGEILKRIQLVIDRVTLGLEMILILVLACGALVLFAAIGVSFDERLRENAVLRTLGSSRKIVLGALLTEFAVLGAIAGLIAALGSELILYIVQTQVFSMPASWHPLLWLFGIVIGTLLITILGLLRSRAIILVPPLQSLRQID